MTHISRTLTIIVCIIVLGLGSTVFAQTTPLQPDCAITDELIGGQGFNFAGQGFNFAGQGFNFAGLGFNFAGQGFNFAGQGFNFAGQGFNFAGQNYADPQVVALEIMDNEIDPVWVANLVDNLGIPDGSGYGATEAGVIIVDLGDHLLEVTQVFDSLAAELDMSHIQIATIDIGASNINFRVASIASAIDLQVQTMRAAGVKNIAINMSLAFIPCSDPITGFDIDNFMDAVHAADNNAPAPIYPIFECIIATSSHAVIARFGYDNENADTIRIEAGSHHNYFSPDPRDQNQPSLFEPGYQSGVFEVRFEKDDHHHHHYGHGHHSRYGGDKKHKDHDDEPFTLSWSLKGPDGVKRTVTASSNSPHCTDFPDMTPRPIIPILECVLRTEGGHRFARFGYDNQNERTVAIQPGWSNKFDPHPYDRGQVTHFLPGRQPSVFEVPIYGNSIKWWLKGPDGVTRYVRATRTPTPCPEDTSAFDLGDYLLNLNVPEDEIIPTVLGYINDTTDDSPLRDLLRGYLIESADPDSPYNTVAIAASGNYRPWAEIFGYSAETPLAPARWPETIAVSASKGHDINQIWFFSQFGNVMARGAGYLIEDNMYVAGTSFAAPGVTAVLAQFGKFADACTYPTIGGIVYPPVRDIAWSNGVLEGATLPLLCEVPLNPPPVALDDSYVTDEDTPVSFDVLENDTDANEDALTATVVDAPLYGLLTPNEDGSFTYTPDENFNGEDSFTYVANDGLNDSEIATVTITVNPINDAPVADDSAVETDEDTPVEIAPAVLDVDGDYLSLSLLDGEGDQPAHGTVIINEGGGFTYTPDENFYGEDSFNYSVSDGELSDTATVTITVHAVNDAPIADDIAVETDENNSVDIEPSASDVDGDYLAFSLLEGEGNQPAHGTVVFNYYGTFTYTPDENFYGEDSFNYSVSDGELSDTATVTITVHPVNDAPVANDLAVETDEDAYVSFILTATDTDGDSLNFTLDTLPEHGELTGAAPNLTYTPDANFNGEDSFTFTVSDGEFSDSGTVTITVYPVNDAPLAVDMEIATNEDVAVAFVLNAADIDEDDLFFTIDTLPIHGSLSGIAPNMTYTPNPNFNGSDSFMYTVSDGVEFVSVTVTITIHPVNDLPSIVLDAVDLEAESLIVTFTTPANGTLTGTPPHLTYTPNIGFNGEDSFMYSVSDGVVTISTTVNINVSQNYVVNNPPQANSDNAAVTPGGVVIIPVLDNDSDPDGDSLTVISVITPTDAGGIVVINPDGTVTYTADPYFSGVDTFSYTITDGEDNALGSISVVVGDGE